MKEVARPSAASEPEEVPPPVVAEGTVVDSYRIPAGGDPDSSALVTIVDNGSFGKYLVTLPFLNSHESRTLKLIQDNLRNSIPIEATGSPEQILGNFLWETAGKAGLLEEVERAHRKFLYFLTRDFGGFWEIDPLIDDDDLEEISVTRYDKPVRVLHRRFSEYMFIETNITYQSEERLQAFIRRLAQFGGTTVSLAQPSLEVTLRGASDRRVSATLGDEISRPGSSYSIRKQKEKPLTIVRLTAPEFAKPYHARQPAETPASYEEAPFHKTLSALMAAYFWLLLERTTNLLIAGEVSSGKTTLMNAILALMNPKAKIVTAEDVLEVNLPDHLHWQRMKTRNYRAGLSPTTGRYEYNLSDLLKLALRFSPTILSLGEMRGEESETVATAITLGFSTITTVHAEDAERCIQRISNPPMRFTSGHVRDITAIATMRKVSLPDGRIVRRVVSVDEIRPQGRDGAEILNIFRYNYATDSFAPTTPEEVLEGSFRLKQIGAGFGWTPENVLDSLTDRAGIIAAAVANSEFSPDQLSSLVRKYVSNGFARNLSRASV